MDLVTGMRVFHAVVDAGSFTAAADRLEMSPAMVSRYVAQLESHLGTRLLHRTTRKISLTGIGADYFQRAVQILGLIEEAGLRAAQESSEPRGLLRVTTSSILAIGLLDRLVVDFMRKHPRVEVELSISERVVDLVEEGFDLAVRVAGRVDGSMVARRLMRVPMVACASARYLKEHGTPRSPSDLARHNCLMFSHSPLGQQWLFERGGDKQPVKVKGSLKSDNGRVLVQAAIEDMGVVYEPAFLVQPALHAKTLVQVLPRWNTVEIGVDAIWPTRKFLHPKVRAFVDFLVDKLADQPLSERSSRRP